MFYLLEFCNVQKSARTKLVVGLSMLTCSTVLQIRWKNCKKIRIKRFVFLIETTKRLIHNNEDFFITVIYSLSLSSFISLNCLFLKSFGVQPYISRKALKKDTLLEKPESNTISSTVLCVVSSKSLATCKRQILIRTVGLPLPVSSILRYRLLELIANFSAMNFVVSSLFVILSFMIFSTDCRNFFESLCISFPSVFSKELIGELK